MLDAEAHVCAVVGPWEELLGLTPDNLLQRPLASLPLPGAAQLAAAVPTLLERPRTVHFGPWALDRQRALLFTLQPMPLPQGGLALALFADDLGPLVQHRRRWASSLHGGLMQLLAAARMEVDLAGPKVPPELHRELAKLFDEAMEAARGLERDILDTLPPHWASADLGAPAAPPPPPPAVPGHGVFLIEAHPPLMSEALRSFVSQQPDLHWAGHGRGVPDLAPAPSASLLLVGLPTLASLELLEAVRCLTPDLPVLAILHSEDLELAEQALRRGAQAWVCVHDGFGAVIGAARDVLAGAAAAQGAGRKPSGWDVDRG